MARKCFYSRIQMNISLDYLPLIEPYIEVFFTMHDYGIKNEYGYNCGKSTNLVALNSIFAKNVLSYVILSALGGLFLIFSFLRMLYRLSCYSLAGMWTQIMHILHKPSYDFLDVYIYIMI